MALIFIDGFDHYAGTDGVDKYFTAPNLTIDTTDQRTGLSCAKMTATSQNLTIAVPAKDTYIVGFSIKLSNPTRSALEDLITFYEDTYSLESQVSVQYMGDKTFRVVRGEEVAGGTELARTTVQFDLHDGWHYIEFKAFINNTTGSFELKFDEESILSATGVDTRNNLAEADEIKHIRISRIEVSVTSTFIDDLYVCDTTGSKNKDFLGDCEVNTIFPKADGALEDWTLFPVSPTDSFALVNDNPPDDDSTYVQSNVSTDRDSFNMDDVSGILVILGIQLTEYARFLTGSASIKHLARVGGTNYLGNTKVLAATYDFHMHIYEDDPDISSEWTISGLNAAEFGMEVV